MDFHKYWNGLSDVQKKEFAKNSGYSTNYISTHLVHRRKSPPVEKIERLAIASNGRLSFYQLCDFFANRTT